MALEVILQMQPGQTRLHLDQVIRRLRDRGLAHQVEADRDGARGTTGHRRRTLRRKTHGVPPCKLRQELGLPDVEQADEGHGVVPRSSHAVRVRLVTISETLFERLEKILSGHGVRVTFPSLFFRRASGVTKC